eukprot:Platyproteum_vivax@DN3920_c0_g1_i1.p1
MSLEIHNLGPKDPFAAQDDLADGTKSTQGTYIHIRNQQRNGRKSLTTVQGIDKVTTKRLLKTFKKTFSCNGTVVDDAELGSIIQLQGDQRQNVARYIIDEGIVSKEQVKVHGA